MSLSKLIDRSTTVATYSKSSTQNLDQRISSINEDDENTDKDQDDAAFDSESEEESSSDNELPRRRGENREYVKLSTSSTFAEAKRNLADNHPNYNCN